MKRLAARLVAAAAVCVASACASPGATQAARLEDVTGPRWHWVGVIAPSGAITPVDANAYWVEFTSADGVVVRADCNSGVGRLTPPNFAIGPIGLTRRLCGPGSLDTRFAAMLPKVRAGILDGDLLRLSADGEELILLRDAKARLVDYKCDGGVSFAVVYGTDGAYLRENGAFRRLTAGEGASGARYADAETLLLTKGIEAILERRGGHRVGPCRAAHPAPS